MSEEGRGHRADRETRRGASMEPRFNERGRSVSVSSLSFAV